MPLADLLLSRWGSTPLGRLANRQEGTLAGRARLCLGTSLALVFTQPPRMSLSFHSLHVVVTRSTPRTRSSHYLGTRRTLVWAQVQKLLTINLRRVFLTRAVWASFAIECLCLSTHPPTHALGTQPPFFQLFFLVNLGDVFKIQCMGTSRRLLGKVKEGGLGM